MQDRPSFAELMQAVRQFLETEIVPAQTDHRARFRTLVAINALTILEREREEEDAIVRHEAQRLVQLLGREMMLPERPDQLAALVGELNAQLAARIRSGRAPVGVLEHLQCVGAAKLRVASPRYLARYG
jgi:hypothetical protein